MPSSFSQPESNCPSKHVFSHTLSAQLGHKTFENGERSGKLMSKDGLTLKISSYSSIHNEFISLDEPQGN